MYEHYKLIIKLYEELCNTLNSYHPCPNISLIQKAFSFASTAHAKQFRKSGEPFIIHPLKTAIILANLHLDTETIVAALLHDIIEDTNFSCEDIDTLFGSEILFLVEGVTKIDQLTNHISRDELKSESFRKLILAATKDIRVIIIKLADRLHNMQTLDFQSPHKQQEISLETLEIYAPIAQRLGISALSCQLEDLAMKYLYPSEYTSIMNQLTKSKSKRETSWKEIIFELQNVLGQNNIQSKVTPHLKHFFSIYRKTIFSNESCHIDSLYDIYYVEILVETLKDCYTVLGVIHQLYNPVPGRFKDYIAIPKSNMYQALHTTLVSKNSGKFEVQIKTTEMKQTALYGILAHWRYNIDSDKFCNSKIEKAQWLDFIIEWQLEFKNNRDYMELIKNDFNLFSKDIFCFTRNGEVRQFPLGSSAIDFAYAIHSDIGNAIKYVLVNGKIKSPEYILCNGDQIEIITSSNAKPNIDWLNHVKTSNAKNKIRKFFNKEKLTDLKISAK